MANLRSRARRTQNTSQEPGIVKLAKCLLAIDDGRPASLGTIFPVSDDVPEHFDAQNPPHGIEKDSREARLLKRLYDSKTKVKCHIESCKQTFTGFGQILNHKRAERDLVAEAKYKCRSRRNNYEGHRISKRKMRRQRSPRIHICLDRNCLASFNKGFNANRHFFTQHNKARRRTQGGKEIIDDSVESKSTTSSHGSSDCIEFLDDENCISGGKSESTPCSEAEERNDKGEVPDQSSHTTVTHSFREDGSAGDARREISSEIREGALSLMKLRYHGQTLPDAWQAEPNGGRYARYAGQN